MMMYSYLVVWTISRSDIMICISITSGKESGNALLQLVVFHQLGHSISLLMCRIDAICLVDLMVIDLMICIAF